MLSCGIQEHHSVHMVMVWWQSSTIHAICSYFLCVHQPYYFLLLFNILFNVFLSPCGNAHLFIYLLHILHLNCSCWYDLLHFFISPISLTILFPILWNMIASFPYILLLFEMPVSIYPLSCFGNHSVYVRCFPNNCISLIYNSSLSSVFIASL